MTLSVAGLKTETLGLVTTAGGATFLKQSSEVCALGGGA